MVGTISARKMFEYKNNNDNKNNNAAYVSSAHKFMYILFIYTYIIYVISIILYIL